MDQYQVLLFFFLIAVLYSSVGFGGGSSYLAILALYGWEQDSLRFIALVCNLVVVTGSSWIYYNKGHLDIKKAGPLVLISVPMAFLGGYMRLEKEVFFILLGLALVLAALLMWLDFKQEDESNSTSISIDLGLGGGIGLLSGLVGIGGGIFLAPALHLIHWGRTKLIAGTAAFFILVNSSSGLLGQTLRGVPHLDWSFVVAAAIIVLIGGQIGARMSNQYLSVRMVKRLTAILVFYVGIRILWKLLIT